MRMQATIIIIVVVVVRSWAEYLETSKQVGSLIIALRIENFLSLI
jgi:hypothetical protein